MAYGQTHAADLPLSALVDDKSQPGLFAGRRGACRGRARRTVHPAPHFKRDPGRRRRPAFQQYAAPKGCQRRGRRDALHKHAVLFLQCKSRVGQPEGELTVVRQQYQPLAVSIEAAHRVDPPLRGSGGCCHNA